MKKSTTFFISGLSLTAVALLARAVALLFSTFVTGAVGEAGIGLYTLMMTVYGFALTLSTAGISLTVTRLVASALGEGDPSGARRVLRAALLYATVLGALATAALLLLAPTLAVRVLSGEAMTLPLRLLALSLLPQALEATLSGYFVGVRRAVGSGALQITVQTLRVGITCALLSRLAPLDAPAACLLLSAVSVGADLLIFLLQAVRFLLTRHPAAAPTGRRGQGAMRAVVAMALPLGLSAYVRSALLTVEHALIPLCLQWRGAGVSEALASYGVLHAMTVPLLLLPMAAISSFASLLVPEFAEGTATGDRGRLSRMTARAVHATLRFATVAAVLIAVFAEELGLVLYGSHEVGYYLCRMAPVVPLMYLDHVTDAMLKGIGEQVYAMWVNISDACLSVLLVWLLIPRMGIGGYALVIVLMEGYNFLLSFVRLRRRVAFSVRLGTVLPSLPIALVAGQLSRTLFSMNGASTTPFWLGCKLLFAICIYTGLWLLLREACFAVGRRGSKRCKPTAPPSDGHGAQRTAFGTMAEKDGSFL